MHALLQTVAHQSGARLLFIKGPTMSGQGLRNHRTYADVDVLVHPDDLQLLVDALGGIGWHAVASVDAPRLLGNKSVTLSHPGWPSTFDLHYHFPGIFQERTAAFDFLWNRRTQTRVAQVDVPVPDLVSNAVIGALNYLKEPDAAYSATEFPMIVAKLSSLDQDWLQRELDTVADALRARTTIAPLYDSLALESASDLTAAEERAWIVMTTNAGSRTGGWLEELRSVPWSRKPGVLGRALWLSKEELLIQHPETPPTRGAVFALRLTRLRAGLASLPGVLRSYRQARLVRRDRGEE